MSIFYLNFFPKHSKKFFYLLPLICSLSTRAEERKEKDPNTGLLFADMSEPYPRDATDRSLENLWNFYIRQEGLPEFRCVTVKEGARFIKYNGDLAERPNPFPSGLLPSGTGPQFTFINDESFSFYRVYSRWNNVVVFPEASFVRVAGYPEITRVEWVGGREASADKKGLLKVTFANIGQVRLSKKYLYFVSAGKKRGPKVNARVFRLNLKVNEKVDVFLPVPRLDIAPIWIQLSEPDWKKDWTPEVINCDFLEVLTVQLENFVARRHLPPCTFYDCYRAP